MIEGLHHIAILCSQREPALKFYRDGLGFRVRESHVRPERRDEVLLLQGCGITLELFIAEGRPKRVSGPEAYGLRHLALKVTELEQTAARLAALGFEPEPVRRDTFSGEKMTFVKDPDGLPIELHE